MDAHIKRELVDCLAGFVSLDRREKIEWVLQRRTRHLTVALEDVYQPHNASAVLRSCDCFGVQDVHIVEQDNTYQVNPNVALGASKWLSLIRYREAKGNAAACVAALKERGYDLVAATPHNEECLVEDLEIDRPLAVFFGTEDEGLSADTLASMDRYVKIPMFGFTESFNVSVSAALILRELVRRLRTAAVDWRLDEQEKLDLRLQWYRTVVRGSDLIERRYLEERA
jgi:tRNA (guanosine-2'-O-)-methyltransferase